MYLVTIDSIVRSALLSQGLSIHYYYQFFHYAHKCFRELLMDTLRTIQTVELTVGDANAIKVPADFIDWVKVGYKRGQFVKELGQRDTIARVPNRDANGNEIAYADVERSVGKYADVWSGYYLFVNGNDNGEHLGKIFGHGNGTMQNSFKFVPERGEIRLDVSFQKGDKILVEYIGYGQASNTTTRVTAYAQDTIENYIVWKYKQSLRNATIADKQLAQQDFYNSLRILRGRLSEVSITDIIRSSRKNYRATIKN